ncbi:protein of unknown function [Candidatus Nitrospira inopinata]|uniref:Uncharacterized protein n=1 Tax=Candidatus Nitrospira inopinata TaxID=1715989 RepID=A0A0S4KYF8_9BACT|nr:protein of unknown function [Candidatus Nitrospira inopinata]
MPQIFDNIALKLLEGLHAALPDATASSFCVGYLNLRGADLVEGPPGGEETKACRLLVGMHRPQGCDQTRRPACVRENWWRARESNPRPLRCERSALPAELAPHACY